MFQLILLLITAAIAYASDGCSFGLAVSGDISGPVWESKDGQLRVGENHTPAKFYTSNSHLINSNGSLCILTPAARQLQCNENEGEFLGFSIGENGVLAHNNDLNFYACPASETEWNIYNVSAARQLKCVAINLNVESCGVSKQWALGRRSLPGFNSPPPEDFATRFRAEFGVDPPVVDTEGSSSSRSPKKFRLPKFDLPEFSMPDADQRSVSRPPSEFDNPEMQYLPPSIDSASAFRNPTPPPSKSFGEKLGLPKVVSVNFGGQAASVPKPSPPAKHHPIAKAAAIIVPNLIGGVIGGMLANALPSLLPKNRHHDKKEGKEAEVAKLKPKTDETVNTMAPVYSASKETAGPELKDTKTEGGTSKLAQTSNNINPRSFRGVKTTLSPVTAGTATIAATVTTITTATATDSSGFKTEYRTISALGGTTSLEA